MALQGSRPFRPERRPPTSRFVGPLTPTEEVAGYILKVKASGAFGTGEQVMVKSGGTFSAKTIKTKVGGVFI